MATPARGLVGAAGAGAWPGRLWSGRTPSAGGAKRGRSCRQTLRAGADATVLGGCATRATRVSLMRAVGSGSHAENPVQRRLPGIHQHAADTYPPRRQRRSEGHAAPAQKKPQRLGVGARPRPRRRSWIWPPPSLVPGRRDFDSDGASTTTDVLDVTVRFRGIGMCPRTATWVLLPWCARCGQVGIDFLGFRRERAAAFDRGRHPPGTASAMTITPISASLMATCPAECPGT
jgi:hypothetical protein